MFIIPGFAGICRIARRSARSTNQIASAEKEVEGAEGAT